jgi:hypothetical protein
LKVSFILVLFTLKVGLGHQSHAGHTWVSDYENYRFQCLLGCARNTPCTYATGWMRKGLSLNSGLKARQTESQCLRDGCQGKRMRGFEDTSFLKKQTLSCLQYHLPSLWGCGDTKTKPGSLCRISLSQEPELGVWCFDAATFGELTPHDGILLS